MQHIFGPMQSLTLHTPYLIRIAREPRTKGDVIRNRVTCTARIERRMVRPGRAPPPGARGGYAIRRYIIHAV